jgi:hypothetical protein
MDEEEQAAWDSFFAEIAGWTFHPGYFRDNATMPTLDECANKADQMVQIRRERMNMRRQRDG